MARRRRSGPRGLVLLALAVAVAGVPAGCRGEGDAHLGRSPGSGTAPDGWTAIAPAPFGGRASALVVPPCPGHAAYQVVARAGERLVMWGGVPEMTSGDPTADGLVWSPPAPDQA